MAQHTPTPPSRGASCAPGRSRRKSRSESSNVLPRSAHARDFPHRDQRKLDGDGLVIDVYNLVWLQGNRTEGLTIPETVVLEQGFPKVWYQWSAEMQELERRLGKEIVFSKLYDHWKAMAVCPIIAQFASCRTGTDGVPVMSVDYHDAAGLHRFLQTTAHTASGVLQRFIQPKVLYNVVLQCLWSPHASLCTGRRNVHLLTHGWLAPLERCCTFDGPANCSAQAVVSAFVKTKVTRELDLFAKHVQDQLRTRLTGLVGFFKFDERGQLFMLQCTSVRTLRPGSPDDGMLPPPLRLGVPFDLSKKTGTSDVITVRFPQSAANETGDPDGLPRIDLTTLTDRELSVLKVRDADIIRCTAPRSRRRRRRAGDGPSGRRFCQAGRSSEEEAEDVSPRRVSLGLPSTARDFPEEFAIATDYFSDVLYRARWHFHQQASDKAPSDFAAFTIAERVPRKPFEFVVPEDVIAIVGYEGIQEFQESFGCEQVAEAVFDQESKYVPQLSDPDDPDAEGWAGRTVKLSMTHPPATSTQPTSVNAFVHERLRKGLPKFQGGIDWERVRLTRKAARRSTRWFNIIGASVAALKAREDQKRQAGLVSVTQMLTQKRPIGQPEPAKQKQPQPQFQPSRPPPQSDKVRQRGPDDDDFLRERMASAGDAMEEDAASQQEESVASERDNQDAEGVGRKPLYTAPGGPRFTKFLQKGEKSRSPPRPKPVVEWRITSSFAPAPPVPRLRRRGRAASPRSPGRVLTDNGFWARKITRPKSAAPTRAGRVAAAQLQYWMQ
eukprot:TRINITY_DN19076_c0_g1_i1.p1 TRINITY_DN19076_c0_g1~~TRINITY_DN19076_c0_g1_i1.p1  ORF type:complete len:778 (+),score=223.11 TRINITY_DN19076_c0_g1_i1:83-2416(+)